MAAAAKAPVAPAVVVFAPRDRARPILRAALPKRRVRTLVARTVEDFARLFHETLVDAALVELGGAHEDTWRAAALAGDFPSVAFFGVTSLRLADGPAVAQCAAYDFVDVLVDGTDDAAARDIVLRAAFSTRFARALHAPPPPLGLASDLQRAAWEWVVSHGGRPVRTSALAEALGVTREHLSRSFAAGGAPNLKRVIDLVRLIAAAELSKNPGHDVRDVAAVLEFASSSHLSTTAQRVLGTRPASLARLRTVDLIERFVKGQHQRSRQ